MTEKIIRINGSNDVLYLRPSGGVLVMSITSHPEESDGAYINEALVSRRYLPDVIAALYAELNQEDVDKLLAAVIIQRLNALLKNQHVKNAFAALVEARVPVHDLVGETAVQVAPGGVGFLGALNGIVGTIKQGDKSGWGYICACYDDAGSLDRFDMTHNNDNIKPVRDDAEEEDE